MLIFQSSRLTSQESKNYYSTPKLNHITELYDHNYENCILCCTYNNKFYRDIYIPGTIQADLCYTVPLIIPSKLKASNLMVTIFN